MTIDHVPSSWTSADDARACAIRSAVARIVASAGTCSTEDVAISPSGTVHASAAATSACASSDRSRRRRLLPRNEIPAGEASTAAAAVRSIR